jgi:hypothetical protein
MHRREFIWQVDQKPFRTAVVLGEWRIFDVRAMNNTSGMCFGCCAFFLRRTRRLDSAIRHIDPSVFAVKFFPRQSNSSIGTVVTEKTRENADQSCGMFPGMAETCSAVHAVSIQSAEDFAGLAKYRRAPVYSVG